MEEPSKLSEKPPQIKQFYRRPLPQSCVDFTSQYGKQIFRESLQAGFMEAFFKLCSQYRTQDEPAYCGLTSLVIALNVLEIDPGKIWKGPWRWYHEDMLDCCTPLEIAKEKGINLDQFECLATCNSLNAVMLKAPDFTVEDLRNQVKCASKRDDVVLVASYSRAVLGQTGDGHFSPIAGYNEDRDLALILDTARFKYPPHWVGMELLYEAMQSLDKDTGKGRGFAVLSKQAGVSSPLLFKPAPTLSVGVEKGCIPLNLVDFAVKWKRWLTCTYPSKDVLESHEKVIHLALSQLLTMRKQGLLSVPILCLSIHQEKTGCFSILCLSENCKNTKRADLSSGGGLSISTGDCGKNGEDRGLKRNHKGETKKSDLNDFSGDIKGGTELSTEVNNKVGQKSITHKVMCTMKALVEEIESLETFKVLNSFFSTVSREDKQEFLKAIFCERDVMWCVESSPSSAAPSSSTPPPVQEIVSYVFKCCSTEEEESSKSSLQTPEWFASDIDTTQTSPSVTSCSQFTLGVTHFATAFLFFWPHTFPFFLPAQTEEPKKGALNSSDKASGLPPDEEDSLSPVIFALVRHLNSDLEKANTKLLRSEMEALTVKFKQVFLYHGLHKGKKCQCIKV